MYMEPTLYPFLVHGAPFTKCTCIGTHAYEIMYGVVRLCMCLTSRIDTYIERRGVKWPAKLSGCSPTAEFSRAV